MKYQTGENQRLFVRIIMLGGSVALCTSMALSQTSPTETIPEKRAPKMRVVDRDWKYFKAVPCDDLHRIVFHSRSEEILLAQRKQQCVNKYKAFLPKPVDR